jgi:hypothetical protein
MPKNDSHTVSPQVTLYLLVISSSFNKCIIWFMYGLGLINNDVIA